MGSTVSYKHHLDQVCNTAGVDWRRLRENVESRDPTISAMAKSTIGFLVMNGILTVDREAGWAFSDDKMNAYWGGSRSILSGEKGRVFFVRKEDAIAYGKANWFERLDNWFIFRGDEKVSRKEIY